MVGNSLLRRKIGITMGIEVKQCHFQATKRFIDDLGTFSDGDAFNHVYKDIYPLNYN